MKVVTLNSIVAVIRARRGYKGFLYKFIEECEIVDAISIPKGSTNGDMIMAMFKCMVIDISDGKVYVEGIFFPFDENWWNASYRTESEKE